MSSIVQQRVGCTAHSPPQSSPSRATTWSLRRPDFCCIGRTRSGKSGRWPWTSCDVCEMGGRKRMIKTTQHVEEKSEPQTPTHGRRHNLPHSRYSLAEQLVGAWHQAAFVKCHDSSRGWQRGFFCVDAHMILPVVVRTVSLPDDWPLILYARSTNRALTCKRLIHTSWWQLWSVCLIPGSFVKNFRNQMA